MAKKIIFVFNFCPPKASLLPTVTAIIDQEPTWFVYMLLISDITHIYTFGRQ